MDCCPQRNFVHNGFCPQRILSTMTIIHLFSGVVVEILDLKYKVQIVSSVNALAWLTMARDDYM